MNVYKDFVILHNMILDPRDVKLFVDWLLSCEPDSEAYKIGDAMQAAIDNYCENPNFEGECRITNALCNHCKEEKRMTEYIDKQRAKDFMGCCLASAKANLKVETSIFKKAEFESIIKTIESMIDVVGAVETADVQPVRRGRWIGEEVIQCSNCNFTLNGTSYGRIVHKYFSYCPNCGARMEQEG